VHFAILNNILLPCRTVGHSPSRYFLAVAEAEALAARLTGSISQPSISQQMQDLEAALRVLCFSAVGNGSCSLTRSDFQEHAGALLHQLENLLHEADSEPGELRGALRLGVIPVLNVPLVHNSRRIFLIVSDQRHGRKILPLRSRRHSRKAAWMSAGF
jgi:hypothetical protein